jgi:hypothetical protein
VSLDEIPPEVLDFVAVSVDSLGGLEVLLLLFGHRPRRWRVIDVAAELRTSEFAAERYLRRLTARGVAQYDASTTTFGLSSTLSESTLRIIATLAMLYQTRLSALVDLMYPEQGGGISDFVDAFQIKRGPPNG